MGNISGKLNLTQLKHKIITSKKGVECLILPIDSNLFYRGEKGVYLDLTAFEIREPKEKGDTHLVKQQLPKDVYDKMSDEDKKATPIIGNLKVWGGSSHGEPDPVEDITLEGDDYDF